MMRALEQILAKVNNWAQFEQAAAALGPKQQGDLFELLTKHYLRLSPVYRTVLSHVWLLEEVPQKACAALKLPASDKGIDLIAKTKSGEYLAIQCKYRTDKKRSLSWRELSTFTGLAFSVCRGIAHALVAHTGERYTNVLKEAEHVSFLSGEKWGTLEPDFFAVLRDDLASFIRRSDRFERGARSVDRVDGCFTTERFGTRWRLLGLGSARHLAASVMGPAR